jgi:predicted transcriptional regulator
MVSLLPVAELLSFLRQTHGAWTERDLSKALNISSAEAKQAIAAMQLQGYVEPIGRTQKWRTTEEGLTVSGAKTARFTREAVEQALSALRDRIQAINSDPNAEYAVSEAVAFGDFLSDQARVQAVQVGIGLTPRTANSEGSRSAVKHKAEEAFLKQLRGKSAALHIQAYEPWMSARSHRNLLSYLSKLQQIAKAR